MHQVRCLCRYLLRDWRGNSVAGHDVACMILHDLESHHIFCKMSNKRCTESLNTRNKNRATNNGEKISTVKRKTKCAEFTRGPSPGPAFWAQSPPRLPWLGFVRAASCSDPITPPPPPPRLPWSLLRPRPPAPPAFERTTKCNTKATHNTET